MSINLNKHLQSKLSNIIYNKSLFINNNQQKSPEVTQEIINLYNNIFEELSTNKNQITETNLHDLILKSKSYASFINSKFIEFYIKYFNLTNKDINLLVKQEILNIINVNNLPIYHNINFENILLNSSILNDKINNIINIIIIKLFNINITHNNNNNSHLYYIFKKNINNLNLINIIKEIYLLKIIEYQSNIHNDNIIHLYKILNDITYTEENEQKQELQIENILEKKMRLLKNLMNIY